MKKGQNCCFCYTGKGVNVIYVHRGGRNQANTLYVCSSCRKKLLEGRENNILPVAAATG